MTLIEILSVLIGFCLIGRWICVRRIRTVLRRQWLDRMFK